MLLIPLDPTVRRLHEVQAEALRMAQQLNQAGVDLTWAFPWGMDPRVDPEKLLHVLQWGVMQLEQEAPLQLHGLVLGFFPSPVDPGLMVPYVYGLPLPPGLALQGGPFFQAGVHALLSMGYAVCNSGDGTILFPSGEKRQDSANVHAGLDQPAQDQDQ